MDAEMSGDSRKRMLPDLSDCLYTSCYCEENVWKLCSHIRENFPDRLDRVYAVFISNKNKQIPLWMQKAGGERRDTKNPVVWDYHVIFVHGDATGSEIYDLDTLLPFPTSFGNYMEKAVKSNDFMNPRFHRYFRVIPACTFLRMLASDRSHMRKPNGEWLSPPPSYPCIAAEDGTTMNLDSFISMEVGTGHGEVMTLEELRSKFMREDT